MLDAEVLRGARLENLERLARALGVPLPTDLAAGAGPARWIAYKRELVARVAAVTDPEPEARKRCRVPVRSASTRSARR